MDFQILTSILIAMIGVIIMVMAIFALNKRKFGRLVPIILIIIASFLTLAGGMVLFDRGLEVILRLYLTG